MAGRARTVEIPIGANIRDFEAQLVRAGVIADETGRKIGDKFNAGTDRAAGGLHKLADTGASFGLPFMGSLDRIGTKLDEAHTKTGRFSTAVAEAGKVVLAAGAVGFAGAAVEATRLGEKFQQTTTSIAANAGITQKAAGQVGTAFLDTAGKSVFAGQQMASAYAAVAGQLRVTEGHALSTADATKVMAAAGNLAEAAQTDLGTATSALSSVMQAYHVSVGDAAKTTDLLFNTSKSLNVPVEQVAAAVDKLHGRLGQLAPSLKDTASLMVAMAQHGITGSRGILAVNTAFQTLVSPTKKVDDVLKALGVSVFDQQGHFVGLQGVISQLHPKLAGLTQQQQTYVAQTLFGRSAGQAMLAIIQQGVPAYQQAASAVGRAGTAQQAATAQSHTLHGEMETLKSTVLDLGTKFGLWLIPKLQATGQAVSSVITWFSKHQAAAKALAATIGSVLGLAVTVFAYTKAVSFVNATKDMVGGIGKLVSGIGSAVPTILAKLGLISGGATATATTVEAENTAAGASFATLDGEIATAVAAADGQMALFAGTVATQDAAIEASNAAAGASFTALLGPIGLAAAAVGGLGYMIGNSIANPNVPQSLVNSASRTPSGYSAFKGGGYHGPFSNVGAQGGSFEGRYYRGAGGAGYGGQQAVVGAAAQKYGIPASVLWGVYGTETTYGKNDRTSSAGAMGAFQFMPGTAREFGYPLTNHPDAQQFGTQADAAARYLSQLYHKYGNWNAALNAYNGNSSGAGSSSYTQNVAQDGAAIQKLINSAGSGKSKSTAAKSIRELLYANPLPGMTSVGRTDMGVDFSAAPGSAVNAIGAGVVDSIIQNWYKGQPLIEEQLTQGPNKGKFVYYAEQLKSLVHIGERVAAGQRIGTVAASGTGLELGFGAGHGRTLAQTTTGYAEGQQTPAGQAFLQFFKTLQHGVFQTVKGGVVSGGGSNFGITLSQLEQAYTNALIKTADTLATKLGNAIQNGSAKTLENLLGVSTGGQITTGFRSVGRGHHRHRVPIHEHVSALLHGEIEGLPADASIHQIDRSLQGTLTKAQAGSPQGQQFAGLIARLLADGQKGLAERLVAVHKSALATLAQEMYAEQVTKDAESLNLQATQARDELQLQQNTDAAELNILKAQDQKVIDSMTAQVTAVRDMTQLITDRFQNMAQSIEDSMQQMADAANSVVTGINDQTQIQVDVLGERGLYGLNLIAQKLQVDADQVKAYWDQQISIAQQNLDTVTAQWHTAVGDAQINLDQVTIQEDQLVALAQQADDTAKVAGFQIIAAAQAHYDQVVLHEDTAVVGPAQTAVDLGATLPKAQQDVLNGILKRAQGQAGVAEGQAGKLLEFFTSGADTMMQNADQAFQATQGSASLLIEGARQTLAEITGAATVAIDGAKATLTGIQGSASIAEAGADSAVQVMRETASTQFAGTGSVINIYGIPADNAAAIGDAVEWAARTQLNVPA